jgi:hypothetical protein
MTPSQKMNARKIFSKFKEAFELDHERKCDAFDKMVKDFTESDASSFRDALKRIQTIIGKEPFHEVSKKLKAALNARRAQASSSSSSSSVTTDSSTASSSTVSSSNVVDDGEVVCVGERTVEQKNKEGFANAIVLDEDEYVTVRVLPPKGM